MNLLQTCYEIRKAGGRTKIICEQGRICSGEEVGFFGQERPVVGK